MVLVPLATLSAICAGLALAGVEGSKHDFTGPKGTGDDLCIACHTPHRATAPDAAPKWNPDADLSRRFGRTAASPKPIGDSSRACLRCHDGTIATDTIPTAGFGAVANVDGPIVGGGGHRGTDHPIGKEYPQIDREYRPMTLVEADGAIVLPEGNVECISCHDPHDQMNLAYMLVKSNERSALCLSCHIK